MSTSYPKHVTGPQERHFQMKQTPYLNETGIKKMQPSLPPTNSSQLWLKGTTQFTKALTSRYDCLYQESSLSRYLTSAGCRKPLHADSQTEHACIHYSAEEFSHQKLSVSNTVDGLGRDREFVLSLGVSTKSTTWNEADFILFTYLPDLAKF